jgi:hypothetical protein
MNCKKKKKKGLKLRKILETYKGPITTNRSKQIQTLKLEKVMKFRQHKFKKWVIGKKEEMKFLKTEKKEKESHGEGLEISHSTF